MDRASATLTLLSATIQPLASSPDTDPRDEVSPNPATGQDGPEGGGEATRSPNGAQTRHAPPIQTYAVQPGDTLATIARKFGLDAQTLLWANDMPNPDVLPVGAQLTVPPGNGVLHRVRAGETLAQLANYFGADLQQIIAWNGLEPPYTIQVGQQLFLPGGKVPAPPPPSPPPAAPADNDVRAPQPATELADQLAGVAEEPLPPPPGAKPREAAFILEAAQAARVSQRETGIPASVTIAQAILESNWGTSRLSREGQNYFGIKARERPGNAGVVWFDTWEVINGQNVVVNAPFRAYASMADSFIDHGRFFVENPRYAAALDARDDAREFAVRIQQAGYATDPAYSDKLIRLMDRFNLYAYDR